MGNERVEGHAEGFRIGWNKGVEKFIKVLKKKYPCMLRRKKCKKNHVIICSWCKVRFNIDKLYDGFCVKGEKTE